MKTKKFTLIDAAIIVVVIAAAIILLSMLPKNLAGDNTTPVTVRVLASEVQPQVSDKIVIGETAVLSYTEEYKGKVVDFSSEPTRVITEDTENKEFKVSTSKTTEDVYITLEVDASVSENAIKVGDVALRVGNFLPVLGKGFAVNGYIIEVLEK